MLVSFWLLVIFLVSTIGSLTPSTQPTVIPSVVPTIVPSVTPTYIPSLPPTYTPTVTPSMPTSKPSSQPSRQPSSQPSSQPSGQPAGSPTGQPTRQPSSQPTRQPTGKPTGQPTSVPSSALQTEIIFDVTIVLSGISYNTYVSNINNNNNGLITSLSSVSTIDSSQITIVSVYSSDYRKLRTEGSSRRELTTSAITVTMQMIANKFALKLNMDDSTFHTYIKTTIETAMLNGNYLSALQSQSLTGFVSGVTVTSSSVDSVYDTVIVHSSKPTSTPTSQPSCGTGSEIDGDGCRYCGPGYITPIYNTESCIPCPVGFYATGMRNFECTQCSYPWTTVFEGSASCEALGFDVNYTFIFSLLGVLVLLFFISLSMAGEARYVAFLMMSFPALDILTDLIYLASSKYYNIYLIIPGFFFTFAPNFIFMAKLYEVKAYCGLFLDYYPIFWFQNDRRVWWIHDHYKEDLWWLLVPVQLVLCLSYTLWVLLVLPFFAFWFVLGIYFFQAKCLSVTPLRNIWYRVWTGTNDYDTDPLLLVDPAVLNESLFAEFLGETLPQLIVQSLNNLWTNTYTLAGYLSTSISVFIAINGLYRYGYYTLWKGVNIDNVPTKITIGFYEIDLPRPKHHYYAYGRRTSVVNSTNKLSVTGSGKNAGSGRGRRFSNHGVELIESAKKAVTAATLDNNSSKAPEQQISSNVKWYMPGTWSSAASATPTEDSSQIPVDIADGVAEDKELHLLLGRLFLEEIKGCVSQAFKLLDFRSPQEKYKDSVADPTGLVSIVAYTKEFNDRLAQMISSKVQRMLDDKYEIDSETELYNPLKAAREMWYTLMSYRKDLKMVDHVVSLGINKATDLVHLDENKLAQLLDVDHVTGIFDHEDSEYEKSALIKLRALADLIVLSNLVVEEEKVLKETLAPSTNSGMFGARGASKDNLAVMVQDSHTADLRTDESTKVQFEEVYNGKEDTAAGGVQRIEDSTSTAADNAKEVKQEARTLWNSFFGGTTTPTTNEAVPTDDATTSDNLVTDDIAVTDTVEEHTDEPVSTSTWVENSNSMDSTREISVVDDFAETSEDVLRIDSDAAPTAIRHSYWGSVAKTLGVVKAIKKK